MSLTEKQVLEITHKLYSTNSTEIITTITEIRKIGEPELITPLVEVADTTKDSEVREAIFQLFTDLRIQEAATPIAEAVEKRKCKDHFAQFLGALWQNQLNYSAHIPVFIQVMIEESYESAIEAFTIIEESLENCSHQQVHEVQQQVKDGYLKAKEHAQPLFSELIKSVESYL